MTVYANADDIAAHHPGVTGAVRREAKSLAAQARRRLAGHHVTGAAAIDVTHGDVDSFVSLVDPAALSIEYGRGPQVRSDGAHIAGHAGLHILGRML